MKTKSSPGFTLVELTICLCIIGILTGGGIVGVSQYFKVQKARETQQKIDFVMNALSVYAQTHYRLPCPADPKASAARAGHEEDDGKCFVTAGNAALYWETEGIVPWKELAIPQNMVVDAWGRYITYKPAPGLTVDTQSASMRDTAEAVPLDVHNACRTALWYDADGNHINRAKALFCCNAPPKDQYLSDAGQMVALNSDWRKWGVLDAATAASIEPAAGNSLPDATSVQITNSWADPGQNPAFNGSFSIPYYMNGPAAPLLRATGLAVVLISHGNAGNLAFLPERDRSAREGSTVSLANGVASPSIPDSQKKNVWPPQMFAGVLDNPLTIGGPDSDIVSWQRSDQLFARVGSGSCAYPSAAVVQSYSCKPQDFRSDSAGPAIRDATTGQMVAVPPLYGVHLALAGSKYQLRASLTKSSDNSSLDDSVGCYVISKDGSIGNVQLLIPSVRNWSKGETEDFSVAFDDNVIGIGLFIVPDGYNRMDSYKHVDLSQLKFVSSYAQFNQKGASITDQVPPVLVSVDPASGAETVIAGAGGVSAYHLYSNLNPGRVSHTLQRDDICHITGEKVGRNHDFTCLHPSVITEAGVNPAHPAFAQIGFEDGANINCYEFKDGGCRGLGDQAAGNGLLADGDGGYIASIGDNTYDDVAFSIGLTACPQKQ